MDLECQKGDEESVESGGNSDNERVVVTSSGDIEGFTEGNGSSGSVNDAGSNWKVSDEGEMEERFVPVDIGMNSENVGAGSMKDDEVELRNALAEEVAEENVCKEEGSCVIDVSGNKGKRLCGDSDGEEVVCRICHLSAEQSPKSDDSNGTVASPARMDLIQLGCECKDDLGTAHRHCAEAWFKLKGNRLCEICGETAKNIKGTGNGRLLEEWRGRNFSTNNGSPERVRCWQGQSFCNFLMACLVVAFVLPWFFRVNMF